MANLSIALIRRLTVLYSIALIGAVFILFYGFISGTILAIYGDFQYNVYTWYYLVYSRLIFQIDGITNCICLLLHNAQTNNIYDKYCTWCEKCIFETCICRFVCPCVVLDGHACCRVCVRCA